MKSLLNNVKITIISCYVYFSIYKITHTQNVYYRKRTKYVPIRCSPSSLKYFLFSSN